MKPVNDPSSPRCAIYGIIALFFLLAEYAVHDSSFEARKYSSLHYILHPGGITNAKATGWAFPKGLLTVNYPVKAPCIFPTELSFAIMVACWRGTIANYNSLLNGENGMIHS